MLPQPLNHAKQQKVWFKKTHPRPRLPSTTTNKKKPQHKLPNQSKYAFLDQTEFPPVEPPSRRGPNANAHGGEKGKDSLNRPWTIPILGKKSDVVILSNTALTPAQLSVLELGLSFAKLFFMFSAVLAFVIFTIRRDS